MSPTGTGSPVIPATDDWRPMAFRSKRLGRIKDPVFEPLWGGVRVLVEIAGSAVRIRDLDGEAVEGFAELEAAIVDAVTAAEVVLDGYLLPAPLGNLVDEAALAGVVSGPTSGQMARQFMLGSIGANPLQRELDDAAARKLVISPDEPAALVAIDLLWLDGQELTDIPLQERKRLLDSVVADHELVRRTVHVRPPVETWYRQWQAFGFHEFAIKDANSRYTPAGASDLWTTAPIPKR